MAFVRVRLSRTEVGRKIEYSYKKNKEDKAFKDRPVKFIKKLESFEISFADSFWLEGEKIEIKLKWIEKLCFKELQKLQSL